MFIEFKELRSQEFISISMLQIHSVEPASKTTTHINMVNETITVLGSYIDIRDQIKNKCK